MPQSPSSNSSNSQSPSAKILVDETSEIKQSGVAVGRSSSIVVAVGTACGFWQLEARRWREWCVCQLEGSTNGKGEVHGQGEGVVIEA